LTQLHISNLLRAIVITNLQLLSANETAEKPELLLARSGLAHAEIAELVGKTQAAVSKAISRARRGEQ
jgi:DNA-directed RNA polymerase specialized sigma24 family protein